MQKIARMVFLSGDLERETLEAGSGSGTSQNLWVTEQHTSLGSNFPTFF